jgi:hypothetical protein
MDVNSLFLTGQTWPDGRLKNGLMKLRITSPEHSDWHLKGTKIDNYLVKKSDRTAIYLWAKTRTFDPSDPRTTKEWRTLQVGKRLQKRERREEI